MTRERLPGPSFLLVADPPTGATFECNLDGTTWVPCTSPYTAAGLADGPHVLEVRAIDADGPDPTPALQRFEIDGTPPQGLAPIEPREGSVVTSPRPTLRWTEPSDAHPGVLGLWYRTFVDGTEQTPQIRKWWYGSRCRLCREAPTLADGPHVWQVTALDSLGNESPPVGARFTVAAPPEARIAVTAPVVLSGTRILLDASGSTDNGPGAVTYAWDPRGRGRFGRETATQRILHRYPVGIFRPAVRVTDAGGRASVARARMEVRRRPPKGRVGVSVNRGAKRTASRRVTLLPVWPPFATGMLVSNDGGFRTARSFRVRPRVRWTLPATRGRVARTVYVRFVGGPYTTDRVYSDDIVLEGRRARG